MFMGTTTFDRHHVGRDLVAATIIGVQSMTLPDWVGPGRQLSRAGVSSSTPASVVELRAAAPAKDEAPQLSVLAMALGVMAVVICYFFVDRQVAWYARDLFAGDELLDLIPRISSWASDLMLMGSVAVGLWWAFQPGGRTQKLVLAIATNVAVTTAIKMFLKWVFGRPWPSVWIHSTQVSGAAAYGFFPFEDGLEFRSFPSGHAAATFAAISILWLTRPAWRELYAVIGAAMCVALVLLGFHFVGDVIAGAMLGTITGAYATALFGLKRATASEARLSRPTARRSIAQSWLGEDRYRAAC
jgi:membrane-associated phospholipid phosphatase